MRHPPKKPRQPERDYSHRSRLDKLGVKPGSLVSVISLADAEFLLELRSLTENVSTGKPQKYSDLIFFGASEKSDLKQVPSFERFLQRNGGIWVVYPKGKTEIRETDVITAAKAAGLVDNKVCSFSETHTALRLVIPLARR
ncbi:MAG: hypothetical protein ACRD50_05125 [Candidatus Acidiferrales bacterium]